MKSQQSPVRFPNFAVRAWRMTSLFFSMTSQTWWVSLKSPCHLWVSLVVSTHPHAIRHIGQADRAGWRWLRVKLGLEWDHLWRCWPWWPWESTRFLNGGTPKWMVHNGKSIYKWMILWWFLMIHEWCATLWSKWARGHQPNLAVVLLEKKRHDEQVQQKIIPSGNLTQLW